MIGTIALANTSISSHNYYIFLVIRTFKIWSPCNIEYIMQYRWLSSVCYALRLQDLFFFYMQISL